MFRHLFFRAPTVGRDFVCFADFVFVTKMSNEEKKPCVDQKPNTIDKPEHVNIKVVGQDGTVVQFKIKKTVAMRKMMTVYCAKMGLAMEYIRFRFDGEVITKEHTPNELHLEDGDTVEVFNEQLGGTDLGYFATTFYRV